jgi:hypothetical protein
VFIPFERIGSFWALDTAQSDRISTVVISRSSLGHFDEAEVARKDHKPFRTACGLILRFLGELEIHIAYDRRCGA